jgi:hypothetical protein
VRLSALRVPFSCNVRQKLLKPSASFPHSLRALSSPPSFALRD